MTFPFRFANGIFRCSTCKQPIDPHADPNYVLDDDGRIVGVKCRDCWARGTRAMKRPR